MAMEPNPFDQFDPLSPGKALFGEGFSWDQGAQPARKQPTGPRAPTLNQMASGRDVEMERMQAQLEAQRRENVALRQSVTQPQSSEITGSDLDFFGSFASQPAAAAAPTLAPAAPTENEDFDLDDFFGAAPAPAPKPTTASDRLKEQAMGSKAPMSPSVRGAAMRSKSRQQTPGKSKKPTLRITREDKEDDESPSKARGGRSAAAPVTPVSSRKKKLVRRQSISTLLPSYYNNREGLRKFLMQPIKQEWGIVKCKFVRFGHGNEYTLSLEKRQQFLMKATSRGFLDGLNMMINMVQGGGSRFGPGYLGKVRSNLLKTLYHIYDEKQSPSKARGAMDVRSELAVVQFRLKEAEPRSMVVMTPKIIQGQRRRIAPMNPKRDGIMAKYETGNVKDLDITVNKQPEWDRALGYHKLDMRDRAKEASVKNFVLIREREPNYYVTLFGKLGKDDFNLDVQYPMSLFQAFGIAIASCHGRT